MKRVTLQMDRDPKERFWEIDFLRGLAIVMMILFHLVYDLDFLGIWDVDLRSGFWLYFAITIASTFFLLVGVSLTLSHSRVKKAQMAGGKSPIEYLKRGLMIFSWGLIITLVTWFLLRERVVVFGVLHSIGVSIILAYPFLKLRFWNLLLGVVFITLGIYLTNFTFEFFWLVWLGLRPAHFYTIDYFPILPWFGLVLIGLFLGNLLYPDYTRRFRLCDLASLSFVRLFRFLGRHSLLIYLIHQPILIALLLLLVVVNIGLSLYFPWR